MSDATAENPTFSFGRAAAVIALIIGMAALAFVIYQLINIFLVLFLGIVVAAALQPWHVKLAGLGIPKGVAVLLIYVLFLVAISLIGLFIGPVLVEQGSAFAAGFPDLYANAVAALRSNSTPVLHLLGSNLPFFAVLTRNTAGLSPSLFTNLLEFTTTTVSFFLHFIAVLAIGFYWTLEVPRLERLVLSLVPVTRRTHVLNIWHEIEFKLGAFIRGQGLTMIAMGVAAGIGYVLIGLPNALVLAVLAGLLEVVPIFGPFLAAVPPTLIALTLGVNAALLVIGYFVLLQTIEGNVLVPRIMGHVVGVSPLVGLFSILAFGKLFGILGAFIAIPLAAIIQVLLDSLLVNPEAVREETTAANAPLAALRTRVQTLRQQMRQRLRGRDTRMGIDPQTPEHVADAVDQQIEQAVERIATAITTAEEGTEAVNTDVKKAVVAELLQATREIEHVVKRAEAIPPIPHAGTHPSKSSEEEQSVLNDLPQATQRAEEAVQRIVNEQAEQDLAAEMNETNGSRLMPPIANPTAQPTSKLSYSGFRLGEHTFFADFTLLPSPLPQGERGPENTLFIQTKTAIRSNDYKVVYAGSRLW